jgi:MtaA/CmuA family methyltransferase
MEKMFREYMSSKERIKAVLSHKIPDRVPMNEFLYSRNLYDDVLGRKPKVYNAEDVMDLTINLGLDMAVIPIGGFAGIRNVDLDAEAEKIEFIDEWGITFRSQPDSWPGDAPIHNPLKNREDWKNYTIPDINKKGRLNQIHIALKKAKEHKIAVVGSIRGPFTAAWMLFGYNRWSLLLYDDPELLDEVITVVTDFFIKAGIMLAEAGTDAVLFADDYGAAVGPLMSPEHYRKHIWPQLKRMVASIKSAGTYVIMHSDGDLRELLSDIVKTGIDAYHPVQRSAHMDIGKVKRKYGKNISLIGNIDNRNVLVEGSVEEVIAQCKECIKTAGPGGGYIFGSDHSLHDDMPLANIYAMIESAKKYGAYPISV